MTPSTSAIGTIVFRRRLSPIRFGSISGFPEPTLVEEMLWKRGIVSYETIRRWVEIWTGYAKQLHRRRPSLEDIWHLDEAVFSIAGRKHWLWRAVDQDGYVLDELVKPTRYQGCQAGADQAAEETRPPTTQADHHRQTSVLTICIGSTPCMIVA